MTAVHEALIDRVAEEREERRKEATRVDEHDGLEIEAEALERYRLEQLLERARAAGERDRRVAPRQHEVLAGAQVLHQLELGESAVPPFELRHEARQDADDAPPFAERSVGQRAHGADRAAAVDDTEARRREHFAQAVRGGAVLLMRGAARGTVNTHRALDRPGSC